ncbi:MAG: LysM peptidoglycan-binding domain-containing protein [Tepidiformaceae bacterium]
MRFLALPLAAGLGVLLIASACGGGPSSSEDEGPRISDPASAPTATPMQGAPKYLIKDNVVTLPGSDTTATTGQPPAGGNTYTVKANDTCGAIATALDVSTEALIDANPGINSGCTNLHEGDVLKIPASASPQPTSPGGAATPAATARPSGSGETYTVASGDTCVDIAASYNVDVDELIALNGLDASCKLAIDQVLEIP